MQLRSPSPRTILLISLGLIVLLRIPFIHVDFFNVDEAVSSLVANAIVGGGLPYRDAIDHRGPLTYYFYAMVFALFGKNNMTAIYLSYIGVVMTQTYMIFLIGKKMFSEKIGASAALIFSLLHMGSLPEDMLAAHTEWLAALLDSAGIFIFLYRKKNPAYLLLAGVLLGLGSLSKQTAGMDWAALMAFVFLVEGLQNKLWKTAIRDLLLLGIGFAIPILAVVLFFHSRGAWDDLWFYLIEYNVSYYMKAIPFPKRLIRAGGLMANFFGNKLILLALMATGAHGLFFKINKKWRLSFTEEQQNALLLILLTLAATLSSFAGGRMYAHYLILAFPSYFILAAVGWEQLKPFFLFDKWKAAPAFFFQMIIWSGLIFPPAWIIGKTTLNFLIRDQHISFRDASQFVHDHTSSENKIFVWGFDPEFYLLANRPPASRFTFFNMIVGLIPGTNPQLKHSRVWEVPGTMDTLMSDLRRNKPVYFIERKGVETAKYYRYPIRDYPDLYTWLHRNYRLSEEFEKLYPMSDWYIYERINPPRRPDN